MTATCRPDGWSSTPRSPTTRPRPCTLSACPETPRHDPRGAVDLDVAIVGAGAAGLATAIFTRRLNPSLRVAVFDGSPRPGAKILVSGGSRCNVTNAEVTPADFNGGRATAIAMVLKALPVPATVAFFEALGVRLVEEPGGKLFPVTNRSRDVLEALLRELHRGGADLRAGDRVLDLTPAAGGFLITSARAQTTAAAVVVATGGLSLPKTGSDGWGYPAAARLGHTIVPTTPALVPLLLASGHAGDPASGPHTWDPASAGLRGPTEPLHRRLAGVSQPVRLDIAIDGRVAHRVHGPLLWTHVGISGPAALDASRHWLRADLEARRVSMTASLCPDASFATLEAEWMALGRSRPRLSVEAAVAQRVPRAVAAAMVEASRLSSQTLAGLTRDERRRIIRALTEWPLAITGSRGYTHAEVTAGGVALAEVSPRTMESRKCPGLYFVGEVLDVDGRIGGFNFQWSWSSARVAAQALARPRPV